MLETGTNRSKYQFIPNKSKFIPGTNPSEALSPLLRLKISWSLCWKRRDGGIRNEGCWRDQRRKAWNHDSHGGDVITMLFLGLKTKNTVAIKIWDNMYVQRKNSFCHHALRNMNINILDLSQNMIWLDPQKSETMGQAPVTVGAARAKLGKAGRSRGLGAHSWVG